ncbi:MAG TPA: class D sortase [Candidatus Dormibacteraeota bacterium]|nr:class D sortase [Candidatus Dormibacteraeota bacterium]
MIDRIRSANKHFFEVGHLSRRVGFLAAGFLVIAYCTSAFGHSQGTAVAEISKFERAAPGSREVSEGGVIGDIMVPRLGLRVVVAEGVSDGVLKRAAGHVPETSLPGQQGNVALAAHRNSFFGPLRRIRLGDVIVFKTAEATFLYQVESTSVVEPTNIQVLEASTAPTLTLITCFPFDYVGAAPRRFIVRAREVRATTDEVSIHQDWSVGQP